MNLRWLIFDYADPHLPLTFRQRLGFAWPRDPNRKRPRWVWRGRVLYFVGVMAPYFILPLIFLFDAYTAHSAPIDLNQPASSHFTDWLWIATIAYSIVLWPWSALLYGLACRKEQRYRIRLEGYDICIKCGYWLRGLDDSIDRCPECGAQREAMPDDAKESEPPMNADQLR